MDNAKCKALKAELAAQPEPQIVSVERFFDGNDERSPLACSGSARCPRRRSSSNASRFARSIQFTDDLVMGAD